MDHATLQEMVELLKPASAETFTLFYQSASVALAGGPAGEVLAVGRHNRTVVLDEKGAMTTAHPRIELPKTLHEGDQLVVEFGRGRAKHHGPVLGIGLRG